MRIRTCNLPWEKVQGDQYGFFFMNDEDFYTRPCGPSLFDSIQKPWKVFCWSDRIDVEQVTAAFKLLPNKYIKDHDLKCTMMTFAFQIEATRVMAFSRAIEDGDHAIKTRVLACLV
jgi:hypothetical protein